MSRVSVQARHVSPVMSALVDRYEIETTAAEPGARYLRDVERADERLCRLVAHHSCAAIEAAS
jgi:hypothetical protein